MLLCSPLDQYPVQSGFKILLTMRSSLHDGGRLPLSGHLLLLRALVT